MKFRFGYHDHLSSRYADVVYDTDILNNGHMLLCGMSGSGKTWMLNQMLNSFALTAPRTNDFRIHVFDVHGDIRADSRFESSLLFSEQTDYGLNPFRVDPDPHTGGVRKRVQGVLNILNRTSRDLGEQQEAVFRNLAYDTYRIYGFDPKNPSTWFIDEHSEEVRLSDGDQDRFYLDVPIGEKDEVKELGGRWDAQARSWYITEAMYQGALTKWPPKLMQRRHPSLQDMIRVARHVAQKSFLGINNNAMQKLFDLHRAAGALRKRKMETYRSLNGRSQDTLFAEEREKLHKAQEKAIDAFSAYAKADLSGHELDDMMRYDNYNTLSSTLVRLENLDAIGIFKTRRPPFEPAKSVWRYDLTKLDKDEATMFTLFRLEDLLEECMKKGECKHVRCVVLLDEAKRYAAGGKGENILDRIANEARKFGMVMILSSQAPYHFTQDSIGSMATKVLLRIDESYWGDACKKMQLTRDELASVKPKMNFLVQMKGENMLGEWKRVRFGHPVGRT